MARGRERIDTGRDVRYVRRDERGRFTSDQEDVGRASAADQRKDAAGTAARGHGDRGDGRAATRDRGRG
ncbi:MAG TPA: hypothetical protein VF253_13870 [Candidatus Limnocylindrales bacterium]